MNGAPIKKAIEAAGFKKVDVIGFDIMQRELVSAAESIIKMFKQAKRK